jgi:lysophospholipase L1-like esterase
LSELCRRHGIEFVDLNEEQFPDRQWLFVDRIHMNDAGQKLTADLIAGRLSS